MSPAFLHCRIIVATFPYFFSSTTTHITLPTLATMSKSLSLSLLLSLLPLTTVAETVIGVYIYSRHGDRTSKSTPPTVLTPLGYSEIFASGSYYRDRYISSNASSPIAGISSNLVNFAQISASATYDTVLMPSAQGFLQGLYPPVGVTLGAESLRDNRSVETPLNGYQLIPVQTVTTGTGSEDSAWLQGASNCANAITSSNGYFLSPEYQDLLSSTGGFYKDIVPVVNATFAADTVTYKNAYASRSSECRYLDLGGSTDDMITQSTILSTSLKSTTALYRPRMY